MIKFLDEKEAIEKYGKGLETPVLYVPFNRPELAGIVFGQIRKVKPKKLYIAQDGPREYVEGEKERILKVREYILSNIDWDCEVNTRFSEKNVGLDEWEMGAERWLYENEEQGIVILEDVYVSLSGFYFLEKMLNKFKNHNDVWFVCAYNIVDIPYDYVKTHNLYAGWAYASWGKKWLNINTKHREDVKFFEEYLENNKIKKFYKAYMSPQKDYLIGYGSDIKLLIEMLLNNAYSIIPKISLAVHLGFFNGAHGTSDIINDNVYKYHPRVEDLKEIDVDALEDYMETPIIKTFEKVHVISENFNIFNSITSDKAETNLKNIVSTYKKIAIYGAGMLGYLLYATYDDLLSNKVCCFLDDDPKDVELMGKPIIKPENIPDDVDLVIISPHSKKAYENMKEKVAGKKAVWLRDLVF
ncbi:MAG: hypothetical protein RXR65_02985 [Hydrogenobaculum sp.]